MKFTIQTEILKKITQTLSRIVSKNIPGSSSNIIIEVSSKDVIFRTKQFDFNIVYTVKVETKTSDGTITVPIDVIDGVISSLIDNVVSIEFEKNKVFVRTSTSVSEIYSIDNEDEDGVMVTKPDTQPSFTIKREILVQGFRNVQHAAAESVIKPEIASVYMYTKNNSVYFVSTDTFRLTEIRFLLEKAQDNDDISILIPIKNVDKIIKVLENIPDSDVKIYIDENEIHFMTDTVLIKINSVKGNFPDYKSIIPENFDMSVTVLRSDMLNFLKKARLFSDKLNRISLSVQNNKALDLKFGNETVGTTQNTIPIVLDGESISPPSFNYRFISDVLSIISDDRVVFNFINDKTKPLMIRGSTDTALTSIVSPLLD